MTGLEGRPVIIGAGLAGLMTALCLAPEPVVVLSKFPLGSEASSALAQGGIAASCGEDDSPALHLADTLAVGGGLCDADIARSITKAGATVIERLARRGVRFDCAADGSLVLGLEAAHGRRRIVHAEGDGTGREIMRALIAAVRRTPSIVVLEGLEARRLMVEGNVVFGVLAAGASYGIHLATNRVVIATGGIGGLFGETTNPTGCFGHGLALAARAGAGLADIEFIQFHPTALDTGTRPLTLISEAVRGEGAILIDETGYRFMEDEVGAELASRDVVARAIWRCLAQGRRVFLDARQSLGGGFARRFPGIDIQCKAAGIDPATMPIPVRPAAHYHMGGIAVNAAGKSSVTGLWACGEVACTGLHGANRLASNSLLEAAASAAWVAESVASVEAGREKHRRTDPSFPLPPEPEPIKVQPIMSQALGVLRDRNGLVEAISKFSGHMADSAAADPAIVGLMIAVAALRREESRGAHYRTDFPETAAMANRSVIHIDDALAVAHELRLLSFSSERLQS